jgi:hypothetical protein
MGLASNCSASQGTATFVLLPNDNVIAGAYTFTVHFVNPEEKSTLLQFQVSFIAYLMMSKASMVYSLHVSYTYMNQWPLPTLFLQVSLSNFIVGGTAPLMVSQLLPPTSLDRLPLVPEPPRGPIDAGANRISMGINGLIGAIVSLLWGLI